MEEQEIKELESQQEIKELENQQEIKNEDDNDFIVWIDKSGKSSHDTEDILNF